MKNIIYLLLIAGLFYLPQCADQKQDNSDVLVYDIGDSLQDVALAKDSLAVGTKSKPQRVSFNNADPDQIVNFAETLIGVPYKYAATDPSEGFDCSGFITYVYNHFNISVPRSSVDFTNVGTEINERNARRGDLILFTGTDSTVRVVGHMGIITENKDILKFIHSTSGKQYSVTITPMSNYYRGRFVKVIRLG